jgi:histidinol-phosphate aminotransferase
VTDASDSPIRPRDDLALVEGYHSPQVEVAVRLNTNESPLPPPPEFVAAIGEELERVAWHRYPDRAALELRRAIGALHGVSAEWVFAANGSNEVLQTLLLTFGGPGRSVAVFEPTYALHSHIARLTATEVVTGERSADFTLDRDEVERVLANSRPAITFLCSPNNPTGLAETNEAVRWVLDRAPGLVVVDEAYGQFAAETALDLLAAERPLVVTRTYSKTWSMAAARLGYLIAPPWIVDELTKVALPYHLDALKQAIGRRALEFADDMEARVSHIVEERGRMIARLVELPVDVWPYAANFVLFRPRQRDGQEVWKGLLEASVLVRNCVSWPRLENCLRVTIGTADENDRFLEALTEVLA